MERTEMYIGQKVKLAAKDIVTYKDNPECEFLPMIKKVHHQKEKIMFVRELHNLEVAGLSYTMDTPAKDSYGILYSEIQHC